VERCYLTSQLYNPSLSQCVHTKNIHFTGPPHKVRARQFTHNHKRRFKKTINSDQLSEA